MESRRTFITAAAAFAAGTVVAGTADAAQTDVVTLLHGRGVPHHRLGITGDFYIDDSAHAIYGPKHGAGWGRPTSLMGPRGVHGVRGPHGARGVRGAQGLRGLRGYSVLHGDGPPAGGTGADNDFYIDTRTTQLYGPREDGLWGSPVSLTGSANVSVIDGGAL